MAEDKGFTVIPNAIFDLDLTSNEYKVLVALYSFNNKEKGYAYPSYKQLKQRGKISDDRTLIKAINGLVDKNNITKIVEQGIGTRYFITDVNDTVKIQVQENYSTSKNTGGRTVKIQEHPQENYSTTNTNTNTNTNTIYSSSKDESDSKGNSEKDNNSNSNTNNKKKKNTKSEDFKFKSKDHEEAFKEIWSLYPNKKGIAKARERINKLLDRISKDELIRCVQRYKAECIKEKRENKYIQQGSTFFNGPYEDYLDCNYEEITSLSVDESVKRSKQVEF